MSALFHRTSTCVALRRSFSALVLLLPAALATGDPARAQSSTPFCFGDGTAVIGNCPCGVGQNGSPGEGCLNSSGAGGLMTAAGNPCVTGGCGPDTLTLTGTGLPLTTTCILLQAPLALSPELFLGDGIRCLGGTIVRIRVVPVSSGTVTFGAAGTPSISSSSASLGWPIPAGATRYYQIYYRDPAVFCTAATYNLTNGMTVVWR